MFTSNLSRAVILICLVVAIGWRWRLHEHIQTNPAMQIVAAPVPVENLPTIAVGASENNFSQPDSSDSNEQLLELARAAVARSPELALKWAQSQSDEALRERLLFAVVQAWGESDPHAAVAWAQTQDEGERQLRMEAALAGAVRQPEVALQIGRELLASTDEETGDAYGTTLVGALARAGNFQAAMEFLNEAPADARASWTAVAVNLWAQSKPDEAAKAVEAITDETIHAGAFEALVSGWAVSKPDTLADYALKLSSEKERTLALNTAMENWFLQDPVAMSEWMNSLPPSPALDGTTALMVTRTDSVERDPEVAMSWVAGITDASLRYDSLLHVAKEWAQTDAAAAENFIKTASWLDAGQREEVLQSLSATARTSP